MDKHDAAAHLVAKHLRAIARLLPDLQGHGASAILDHLLQGQPFFSYANRVKELEATAEALEEAAPFEPITDEQRAAIREQYAESIGDLNYRERADLITEDWTEAEWRMEQDDQDGMNAEERSEIDDATYETERDQS